MIFCAFGPATGIIVRMLQCSDVPLTAACRGYLMRIDDVVSAPQKSGSERLRRLGADVAQQSDTPTPHTPVEDVVQLTLGHDGVWEVRAASPSPDAAFENPARPFAAVFPRASQLYHTLWHVYSPAGLTQAIEYTRRGLLVDVYI
jgi:hypothetical protein